MPPLLQMISYKACNNWSVAHLLEAQFHYNQDYDLVRIGDFLTRNKTQILVQDDVEYKRVTIRLYNKGVRLRDKAYGKDIGTKKQYLIKKGDFLLSKIDARNGAFGLATDEVDGAIITADFFAYDIDTMRVDPQFLVLMTTTKQFMKFAQSASSGTTGRQRIEEKRFLNVKLPIPSIQKQRKIISQYNSIMSYIIDLEEEIKQEEQCIEDYLNSKLGISFEEDSTSQDLLAFIKSSELISWGVGINLQNKTLFSSSKYKIHKLGDFCKVIRGVTYKKSSETSQTKAHYKVLRANNISLANELNFTDMKYISIHEKFKEIKKLKANDIFICLASGSKKHIGKVAFIKSDLDYYFGGFMGAVRVDDEQLNSKYLYSFLNSPIFNRYLSSKIFGSNINNLNSELLYRFPVPLPPVKEQMKVAEHIGKLKGHISQLKKESKKSLLVALEKFEKEMFDET